MDVLWRRQAALRLLPNPLIFSCKAPVCRQSPVAGSIARVFRKMDRLTDWMYADAIANSPPGHIADLRDVFDQTTKPVFTDLVHVNEDGTRLVAERIANILNRRPPAR